MLTCFCEEAKKDKSEGQKPGRPSGRRGVCQKKSGPRNLLLLTRELAEILLQDHKMQKIYFLLNLAAPAQGENKYYRKVY